MSQKIVLFKNIVKMNTFMQLFVLIQLHFFGAKSVEKVVKGSPIDQQCDMMV
jgi:hypothetical protein